jgi:preprotein translocase subunit SecG
MYSLISIVHLLVCFCIIGLVLLQQGKGSDMGASFGAGSSQTVFGAQGASNFFSKSTAVCAALFFATCLFLTLLVNMQSRQGSLLGKVATETSAPSSQKQNESNLPDMPE